MDFEFIRFRIDPAIHEKAAKACSRLGLEVNDVLRALVTRIARDGTVPFDIGASAPPPARERTSFHDYDPALWGTIKPRVEAEAALSLLMRFIADCSFRIDEEAAQRSPNRDLLDRLRDQHAEAKRLLRELDVNDRHAVNQLLQKYGSLLRAGDG